MNYAKDRSTMSPSLVLSNAITGNSMLRRPRLPDPPARSAAPGVTRWSFIAEPGPSQHYRAELMALGLAQLGDDAKVYPAAFQAEDKTIRGWDPATGEHDQEPPHVVVGRFHAGPPIGEVILDARRAGQLVALDFDDDYWHTPERAPARAQLGEDGWTQRLLTTQMNMSAASLVVAATPALGAQLVHVLDAIEDRPPFVPVAWVRSPVLVHDDDSHAPIHNPPSAGWVGTWREQGSDLELIRAPLAEVLPRHGAIFRHLGRVRSEVPLPILLDEPPYVIHEHDQGPLAELRPLLLGLDLCVIPADHHDPYSRARSATIGLAAIEAGVPVIASPTPEYERLAELGLCTVAYNEDEWRLFLNFSLALRCEESDPGMALKNRAVLIEHYSPNKAAAEWQAVIANLKGQIADAQ